MRVNIGRQVFDKEKKSIGRINDVFGPTKNPYISIEPAIVEPERYVRQSLYVIKKGKNGKR
jgi:RNA-binding protein